MSFIPYYKKLSRYDETDNQPIYYLKGTHEYGDDLPTDHVEQGSYSMDLSSKNVLFFNADTQEWE